MTTVLCVPQWQGSASSGAPRLTAGARRAAALVPADAVVTVAVLETTGEKVAGITDRYLLGCGTVQLIFGFTPR